MLCFFVGRGALSQLSRNAYTRLHGAFRPKTSQCYSMLFRTFLAFCVYMQVSVKKVDCKFVLPFLECLAVQNTSVHMLANYLSAVRAMFVMFNLNYQILDDPKIKYFIKSVRINRPLMVPRRHILDLKPLQSLISHSERAHMGLIFKVVFLTAFFWLSQTFQSGPSLQIFV